LWGEASDFLEFWLPFFQEKGKRKRIENVAFKSERNFNYATI